MGRGLQSRRRAAYGHDISTMARLGDIDAVRSGLEAGYDVNMAGKDGTALYAAAQGVLYAKHKA